MKAVVSRPLAERKVSEGEFSMSRLQGATGVSLYAGSTICRGFGYIELKDLKAMVKAIEEDF